MITIDPEVFGHDEERDQSREVFVVSGDFEPAVVVAALDDAAERLSLVDETGVEHPDQESMERAAREQQVFGASYVSDAEVTEAGVEVYVDCQSSISEEMAETMRRVVREALESASASVDGAPGWDAHVRAVPFED